jgi:heat shock protein HslJ
MNKLTKWAFTIGGAVVLTACSHTVDSRQQSLEETIWTLIELPNQEIPVTTQDDPPHLLLSVSDKRVAGSTGCNLIMGTYELNGEQLQFSELATTMMACPHAATTEHRFLQALEQVDSWQVTGELLTLTSSSSDVSLTFTSAQN